MHLYEVTETGEGTGIFELRIWDNEEKSNAPYLLQERDSRGILWGSYEEAATWAEEFLTPAPTVGEGPSEEQLAEAPVEIIVEEPLAIEETPVEEEPVA